MEKFETVGMNQVTVQMQAAEISKHVSFEYFGGN
jgi:hypothetical protein